MGEFRENIRAFFSQEQGKLSIITRTVCIKPVSTVNVRAAANYILKANNSNSQLEAKLPTTLFSDAGHGGGSPGEQGGRTGVGKGENRGRERKRQELTVLKTVGRVRNNHKIKI